MRYAVLITEKIAGSKLFSELTLNYQIKGSGHDQECDRSDNPDNCIKFISTTIHHTPDGAQSIYIHIIRINEPVKIRMKDGYII